MIRVNQKEKIPPSFRELEQEHVCVCACARVSVCWSKTVYLPRELYIDRKLLYRLIWKDTEANRNNRTDIRTDVVSPFFRCFFSVFVHAPYLSVPVVFFFFWIPFTTSSIFHVWIPLQFTAPFTVFSSFIYFLCEFPNAAACVLASYVLPWYNPISKIFVNFSYIESEQQLEGRTIAWNWFMPQSTKQHTPPQYRLGCFVALRADVFLGNCIMYSLLLLLLWILYSVSLFFSKYVWWTRIYF